MKGLFIPDITTEMFRNGCLESIEALMAEGEIYDIDYEPECKKGEWIPVSETSDIPEKEVLACDRRGEEMFGYLFVEDEQWMCESETEIMYDVVAWMNKPAPYTQE